MRFTFAGEWMVERCAEQLDFRSPAAGILAAGDRSFTSAAFLECGYGV
jgi:hypothetical protein